MRFFEREEFRDWWWRHRGKALGALFGFMIGLLFWAVGLFWGIFITALTIAGYLAGKRFDDEGEEGLAELISRILGDRR